jgi:ankyrin repeat protein
MRTREFLLQQLQAIRQEALSHQNPFGLTQYESSDLNTVITTMIHIVENIDHIKLQRNLYSPWGIAPIHLENHTQPEFKFEIDLERTLFNALVEPFIDNYYKLKAAGLKHIKHYCGSFDGYCIDGRTQRAFEYAYRIAQGSSFTVAINQCKLKLPIATVHSSYCWLMAAIVCEQWGKSFKADDGVNAYAKNDAVFDLPNLPLIDSYLRDVLATSISSDFLLSYKIVPNHLIEIYFTIIFALPEMIEHNIFPHIEVSDKLKSQANIAKKFRSLQHANQQLFDEFIADHYNVLFTIAKKGSITPAILQKLFKSLSVSKLLELWKDTAFIDALLALPSPYYGLLFRTILTSVKQDKDTLEEFLNTPLLLQNTVIHLAAETNDAALLDETIQLARPFGINIWAANQNGDSAIVVAAKDQCWDCLTIFLNENEPQIAEAIKRERGKALVYVAHDSEWPIAKKIIASGAQTHHFHPNTHYSALHYALLQNETEIVDALALAKTDLNQRDPAHPSSPTPLICAVSETKVTLDTLACFLTNPGIAINTKVMGETALFVAVRTNQVGKLMALVNLPNIDITSSRTPGDRTTALQIAGSKKHHHAANILKLYGLISRLLDDQLLASEDIRFMYLIEPNLIKDLLNAIIRTREVTIESINRTQFILYECVRHILPNALNEPLPPPPLSFTGNGYLSTTRGLNQLFQLINQSNAPDAYTWGDSVRQEALNQLEIDARIQPPKPLKTLLENIRNEPIFALHRSSFALFRMGRTNAQIKIDALLDTVTPKLSK